MTNTELAFSYYRTTRYAALYLPTYRLTSSDLVLLTVLQTILTPVPPPSDEFRIEQTLRENVSTPLGTSCHFIKDGSKLIITYLNHGIMYVAVALPA